MPRSGPINQQKPALAEILSVKKSLSSTKTLRKPNSWKMMKFLPQVIKREQEWPSKSARSKAQKKLQQKKDVPIVFTALIWLTLYMSKMTPYGEKKIPMDVTPDDSLSTVV